MFYSLATLYILLKMGFLYSLVRVQVQFDVMKEHFIFLGVLFTSAMAFLSYVFLLSYQQSPDFRAWQIWLAQTLGMSTLYFWLLAKFDEGVIFWTLLLLGVFLVYW
jgi:hypothetical protein